MLILTRRVGESLIINDNTKMTVLKVTGNQIRIGVEAPDDVDIWREEVYQRILAEEAAEAEEAAAAEGAQSSAG